MAQDSIPWMHFSSKSLEDDLRPYMARKKQADNIVISVKGGENALTARTLLRYYQMPKDVEMSASLCQELFLNKEIVFSLVDPVTGNRLREIHQFVFGGGDITDKFNTCPWLLDLLFDLAQGLLIKKLMPPSLDYGTPESGSAGLESQTTPTV